MQARMGRLGREYGEECTLPECGQHLRALLRLPPPPSVHAGGGPIRHPVPVAAEVRRCSCCLILL